MKRILISCLALAAFAAPAFADDAPKPGLGQGRSEFQSRSFDASTTYNPANATTTGYANIGAIFSERAGTNSTQNIDQLNAFGMEIPATPHE